MFLKQETLSSYWPADVVPQTTTTLLENSNTCAEKLCFSFFLQALSVKTILFFIYPLVSPWSQANQSPSMLWSFLTKVQILLHFSNSCDDLDISYHKPEALAFS